MDWVVKNQKLIQSKNEIKTQTILNLPNNMLITCSNNNLISVSKS